MPPNHTSNFPMMSIIILVSLILVAGLVGGLANYFMNKPDTSWLWHDVFKSCLLGLTAAATVPLFLQTVSSGLMTGCLSNDPTSFFVFFGFCMVASIFSGKFLQSLGDKLLQEVNQVKQKQEELDETTGVLVQQNSDPEVSPGPAEGEDNLEAVRSRGAAMPLSDEQKIILTFKSGKYAFRTLAGLSQDTGLDKATVLTLLTELETKGQVKKIRRATDGAAVWSLL